MKLPLYFYPAGQITLDDHNEKVFYPRNIGPFRTVRKDTKRRYHCAACLVIATAVLVFLYVRCAGSIMYQGTGPIMYQGTGFPTMNDMSYLRNIESSTNLQEAQLDTVAASASRMSSANDEGTNLEETAEEASSIVTDADNPIGPRGLPRSLRLRSDRLASPIPFTA